MMMRLLKMRVMKMRAGKMIPNIGCTMWIGPYLAVTFIIHLTIILF